MTWNQPSNRSAATATLATAMAVPIIHFNMSGVTWPPCCVPLITAA